MAKSKEGAPRYTVRFPEPLHGDLVKYVSESGRDISSVVREAVSKYLAEEKSKKKR